MIKVLIAAYMVLFASFDLVAEKQATFDSGHAQLHFEDGSNSDTVEISLSQPSQDGECPDQDHCPDCHECHLGHCGFILSTFFAVTPYFEKMSYSQMAEIFTSRDHNSVFRPPIKA